jgi:hypothetical protein
MAGTARQYKLRAEAAEKDSRRINAVTNASSWLCSALRPVPLYPLVHAGVIHKCGVMQHPCRHAASRASLHSCHWPLSGALPP